MLRGIVVAHHVGAFVQLRSDVRGGIDELIALVGVFLQLLYQGFLKVLGAGCLDSFVFHVVGKDEAGEPHPGQLQRGEEQREACHQLQEEGGRGAVLGVFALQIGDVLREVHKEFFSTGQGKGLLSLKVVVQKVHGKAADGCQHGFAVFFLTFLLGEDKAFGPVFVGFQLLLFGFQAFVVEGAFQQGLVLQQFALHLSFPVIEVFQLAVGGAGHVFQQAIQLPLGGA